MRLQPSSQISCLVCGLPTTNAHLGVDACKACANFFKRTSLSRRNYVCRQSSGNCEIRRDFPFLCRRCRYDKCIAMGMRLRQQPGCSTEYSLNAEPLATGHNNVILRTMAAEYGAYRERRSAKELALRSVNIYDDTTITSPDGTKFFISTNDLWFDEFPSAMVEVVQMCCRAFPEYASLTAVEQNTVLKSFIGCFLIAEIAFITEKHFPGRDDYFFVTPNSLCDLQDVDAFTKNSPNDQDFLRAWKFYGEKEFGLMRPILREAAITDIEYYAILCLLIWNFDFVPYIPIHIAEMGDHIRKRVFDELNWYYKYELKCEDFAARLGRLMLLLHTIQEAGTMLQEEFQIYRLMGATREDDLLTRLVL